MTTEGSNSRPHLLMLLTTALLWGTAFVAQSVGARYVDAYTFLAGRSLIAIVCLTPVVHLMDSFFDRRGIDNRRPRTKEERRFLIKAGVLAGLSLGAASLAQQIGMSYTTASKASFITALYIVLVPILGIFLGKKLRFRIMAAVIVALIGMYLLCVGGESLSLNLGDMWVLFSALLYSFEILIIDHFSPLVDGVRLSRLQAITIGTISLLIVIIRGIPSMDLIRAALPSILYVGIVSSTIAYTLQILAQAHVQPAVASLVMSLESVFGALSGWIILHEVMSVRELIGSALIFAAVILSQLEFSPKRGVKAPGHKLPQ